jgi:hypothetical protein
VRYRAFVEAVVVVVEDPFRARPLRHLLDLVQSLTNARHRMRIICA